MAGCVALLAWVLLAVPASAEEPEINCHIPKLSPASPSGQRESDSQSSTPKLLPASTSAQKEPDGKSLPPKLPSESTSSQKETDSKGSTSKLPSVSTSSQKETDSHCSIPKLPPASSSSQSIRLVSDSAPVVVVDQGLAPENADPSNTDPVSEQVQALIKKLSWTKGDYKIVPYGTLWVNTVYETARTNPGNYTLYVLSGQAKEGQDFTVEARSTRLGFDVTGPSIPCLNGAQSGGRFEMDFQNAATTENKGTVLLRHAYLEVKDDTFRILAGQTWDVIAPLNPGMLMYSVGWGGGNIGYRRPQVRLERYIACSDDTMLILQSSINANIANDTLFPEQGTRPGWPTIEGRAALKLGPRGPECDPVEIGVSGHIGSWVYNVAPVGNFVRSTWSANADVSHSHLQAVWFSRRILHG